MVRVLHGMITAVSGVREQQLAVLERLRGSVRVTLRARRWLTRWRAMSPTPWNTTDETVMIANAVELSALTEFVAIHRDNDGTSEDHVDVDR